MNNMILHVDGDSFFAACEMSRHPHLWGQPVVVGQERGIATAMSYEAKRIGITRGMPIFQIREMFKDKNVTILSGHYDLYEMYSNKLFNILSEYFDEVEHYSIDECFAKVDISKLFPSPAFRRVARGEVETCIKEVKDNVQRRLGITFSFGLAANKVLAKVASKHRKPDGLTIITPGTEDLFLASLPIGSVWGIGNSTAEKLRHLGIQTALDFKRYDKRVVRDTMNEPIVHIHEELNGASTSTVHTDHEDQQSIQSTRSFTPATSNASYLHSELSRNIEEACDRLRAQSMYAKHVSIFIKTKATHAQPLQKYISLRKELDWYSNNPIQILQALRDEFFDLVDDRYLYKATGVTLHGLRHKESIPQDLLGNQDTSFEMNAYIDVVDRIQKRFGDHVIKVASSMQSYSKRQQESVTQDAADPYIWDVPLPYLGKVR